jgi:predicted DNA-binding transcriptional regulator AlpA
MYTDREVARKLRVHRITVWKWAKDGRLLPKPRKFGPATSRFHGADLNEKLFGE